MGDFAEAAFFTLRPDVEGGHANDPDDPGGETYMGISKRYHPDVWAKGQPGDIDILRTYHNSYWKPIRGRELPDKTATVVFDFAVNSGPDDAVRALQRALGFEGDEVDGKIGPKTMERVQVSDDETIAQKVMLERMRHFDSLPKNLKQKFGKGWVNRMEKLEEYLGL